MSPGQVGKDGSTGVALKLGSHDNSREPKPKVAEYARCIRGVHGQWAPHSALLSPPLPPPKISFSSPSNFQPCRNRPPCLPTMKRPSRSTKKSSVGLATWYVTFVLLFFFPLFFVVFAFHFLSVVFLCAAPRYASHMHTLVLSTPELYIELLELYKYSLKPH